VIFECFNHQESKKEKVIIWQISTFEFQYVVKNIDSRRLVKEFYFISGL
jgi:hypothetical protein